MIASEIIAGFIRSFWREILIVSLLVGGWLGHSLYYEPKIENLQLRLSIAEANVEQCQASFKDQTDKILEESEETKKVVTERFDRLEDILDNLRGSEQEQIQDILNDEVPESCEELNQYLLDMVERLGW